VNTKALMICLTVCALIATPVCQADLSNKTYQDGKAAYHSEDFGTALELLRRYQNEDHQFLEAHPSYRDAIEAAIAYCSEYQRTHVKTAGASIDDGAGRPPNLP
jgi:hypothetical protein